MRSVVIVVINPASDVLTGFPAAGEGIQIDAFIFEAALQTFDKDGIHPAALAIHRDTNASNLQCAGPLEAGELAPLICVEDIQLAVTVHGFLKGFNAEAGVHTVADPPGQHPAAVPVHYSHQIQKAPLQWQISDIGALNLVGAGDGQAPEQIGVNLVLWMPLRCLRLLVDGL